MSMHDKVLLMMFSRDKYYFCLLWTQHKALTVNKFRIHLLQDTNYSQSEKQSENESIKKGYWTLELWQSQSAPIEERNKTKELISSRGIVPSPL